MRRAFRWKASPDFVRPGPILPRSSLVSLPSFDSARFLWAGRQPHQAVVFSEAGLRLMDCGKVRSGDDELVALLFPVRFGAGGGAALHTEVFIQVACGKDEQQPLAGWRGLSALGTVKQGGSEGAKLILGGLIQSPRPTGRRLSATRTRSQRPRWPGRTFGTGWTHGQILSTGFYRGHAKARPFHQAVRPRCSAPALVLPRRSHHSERASCTMT